MKNAEEALHDLVYFIDEEGCRVVEFVNKTQSLARQEKNALVKFL